MTEFSLEKWILIIAVIVVLDIILIYWYDDED